MDDESDPVPARHRIYYLHIPKTGGQTLGTRLASAFPTDRSWVLQDDLRSAAQFDRLFQDHDFVEGHAASGLLKRADPRIDILCTVRHPVSHVRSLFRHILREPLLRLHPPAKALGFHGFAEHYGDMLFNQQSRTLVETMEGRDHQFYRGNRNVWLLERLAPSIKRVRWLVPTEQIDDFCRWWPLETGHSTVPEELRINVAPAAEMDDEIEAFARENPERFGLDYTLWQIANQHYAAWRSTVLQKATPRPDTNVPSCAFADPDLGAIWMLDGWYPRGVRGDGIAEWWAGPAEVSRILVRRSPGVDRLRLEIPAMIRLRHEQFHVFADESTKRLPARVALVEKGPLSEMVIDLPQELGDSFRLLIQVPRVASLLEIDPAARDGRRRSFASQNWSLSRSDSAAAAKA
ncbi:hypothetical protein KPL78_04880 [Roseomonas sp. HJA6]|uniref:Sulfotransferase family protein n=1 Tax=Roseomonas alba TaxID=2846776 RepID=A0ABS7A4Z2_9PROT|nr:hypothetical protein [Neoroseomonas alba]MBW6397170.1 hypothetical protein [Neoroseomonas alba]